MNTLAIGIRAVAVAAIAALPLVAAAQSDYPNRPVKVLVPYAPGGATDIIARHVAAKLNDVLGQSVVVENRAGASGNVALDAAAKSPPDGYTLLCGNVSTNAINETTFAQTLQSKPSRDLTGITKLVEIPHIIVATPSLPVGSVAELVAYAKQNPGKLNYASAGLGTYPHLDMVVLEKTAGIVLTHVPYKGGAGQMLPSLMAGETQVAFINLASSLPQVRAGKLKALATTAPARLAELPDVATMAEQGYPGIGTNAWQGLFAPAATPKPVIDKLYASVAKVLSQPEMKEMLAKQMMTVTLSASPDDFQRTRPEGDGGVGEGGAGEQGQDRLTARDSHGEAQRPSLAAALRPRDREGPRDPGARRRPARGRSLPAEVGRPVSRSSSISAPTRRTSCGCRRPTSRRAPNPYMNWETVNPLWWVPRGYAALRVDTRGTGKSPGRTDPFSPSEARDFYDVIEWAARQPWCNGRVGAERDLVLRDDAVAGREPPAAVARGDDPVGRRGRHVPRLRLSRRDLLVRVRRQLVQQPHGAPPARAAAGDLAGCVRDAVGVGVHAPQPGQRLVPRTPADLGEHRLSVLQRRQLERDGAAPARQHRGLPAGGFAAQEAAHPRRHPLPRLLHEGRPARPAPLPRSLAEGHRHRDHARAAGEAPHPQGRSRQRRVAAGAGLAAPTDALDEVLSPARAAGERRRRRGDARHGGAAQRRIGVLRRERR